LIDLSETKNILYVQTSGLDTPERLYAPFILATTAVAMGVEATVYFLIKGITVVKKGEAEKVQLGSFPTLKQVMDQAIQAGVKLMVCEQSCQLLNLGRGDFDPGASVVGAATLNDLLLDADAVLSF
jgi:predicted peroxiredoxin